MACGINKVLIIGNVGQEPEVKCLSNGDAVANISLATDESYKDKQTGQIVQRTEWHRCTAYGKLAEIIGQYVKKGSKLYVEGRLATRKWQAQDGSDRYSTEIKISDMQMLDGKPEGGQAQQRQQPAPQQRQAPQQTRTGATSDGHPVYGPTDDDPFADDQIPF